MEKRILKVPAVALMLFCLIALITGASWSESASPAEFKPNECGDGKIDLMLEDFETLALEDLEIFKPDPAVIDPVLDLVEGCAGQALSIEFDLTVTAADRDSWVVVKKSFDEPRDISAYSHIRIALKGLVSNNYEYVDVKLADANSLHAVKLKSMTDLPEWRPIYIDLRELSGSQPLDLTAITSYEIGIGRCDASDCEIPDRPGGPELPVVPIHAGTMLIDEFALVDLTPAGQHRLVQTEFETVPPNRPVAKDAAGAILAQVTDDGTAADLVPAWFQEFNLNYNSYAQAEALLVFVYEYQTTKEEVYLNAARALGKKLIDLQIGVDKVNAGAWFTAYDAELTPPFRPIVVDSSNLNERCDGDETLIPVNDQLVANNIDGCMWVGNVAWILIALDELRDSGIYADEDPAALDQAIAAGGAWLVGQMGRDATYPSLISHGAEGNISAYFGLKASGNGEKAAELGDAIFATYWDESQHRLRPGLGPTDYATAIDVAGSWGVDFLRDIGREPEALASLGYAATVMRTSSFDNSVTGYGDIAGPFTVTTEFGAQAAAAGILDAEHVMQQLYTLQSTDAADQGAFPGAPNAWYGGSLPPWNTTMTGVSPTAWVYFVANGPAIDPPLRDFPKIIYLPLILLES